MNARKLPDAAVILSYTDGTPHRTLSKSVRDLILDADARARTSGLPATEAVDAVLRETVAQAGVAVAPVQLNKLVRQLDEMRKATSFERLEIPVSSLSHVSRSEPRANATAPGDPPPEGVFEPERQYPDPEALALYDRLAGIDAQKAALFNELALATNPARVVAWSRQHHTRVQSTLLTAYRQRVPLIVLQGDVGTGKTALAESVGAALVRDGLCSDARLLKLTGQVRGQGLVGQMSDEIVKAFAYAEARATTLGAATPLLLLVDEADAIATSRAGEQMHHEDKAGVNTLLQRLDHLKTLPVRPVVVFITNRAGAVDPAIARRAGTVLRFERPAADAREAIFGSMLTEYGFSRADIKRLAHETERKNPRYTASDLVDKILVRALQEAVRCNKPLTVEFMSATIKDVEPSPAFQP
ncbi:MAG: ATP-binding protein [Candidatus Eremiobacteraeota bacterium]|nr:ATP-binding protein [Candidatus Eremiobacteraeota bacterium]